jgi:hypothetical protein
MPDDQIDLTDAPEIRDWQNVVVGKFCRSIEPGQARRKSVRKNAGRDAGATN